MELDQPDKLKRSLALDALRGLAIALVMVLHYSDGRLFPALPQPYTVIPNLGMFGVDLFYVLSGFFITRAIVMPAQWEPSQFLKARVTRIYPAFLVALFGIMAIKVALGQILDIAYGSVVVLHLLMLHNLMPGVGGFINGPFWTLGVEFPFYLLMLALGSFLRAERYFWRICISMVAICLAWRFAVFNLLPPDSVRFFASTQLPGALDDFALGGMAAGLTLNQRLNAMVKHWRWPIFGFGTALWFLSFWHFTRHAGSYWIEPFSAIVWRATMGFSFAVVVVAAFNMAHSKTLRYSGLPWLGKISFSLYMYHYLPIELVNRYLVDLLWPAKLGIALGGGLAVSWLSWRFIEIRFHQASIKRF